MLIIYNPSNEFVYYVYKFSVRKSRDGKTNIESCDWALLYQTGVITHIKLTGAWRLEADTGLEFADESGNPLNHREVIGLSTDYERY